MGENKIKEQFIDLPTIFNITTTFSIPSKVKSVSPSYMLTNTTIVNSVTINWNLADNLTQRILI